MGFPVSATAAAVLCLLALISAFSRSGHVTTLAGSDVAVNVTPTVLSGSVLSTDVRCARVTVSGLSRPRIGSYFSARRITLVPSYEIHEKLYRKIQICLHSNASIGLCQCETDQWENIPSGIWNYVVSPYEDKYIDVMFVENLSGSVSVTIKSEFHKRRLLFLAIGFVSLLLAPIVSSWVPFYYSISMAIGICQVLVFLIVGIVLAGAGFGYWLVRKFVVAEDGSVDVGVAQSVKWSLLLVGATYIFQSAFDTSFATAMLVCFPAIYFLLGRSGAPTSGQSLRRSPNTPPVEGPSPSVESQPTNPQSTLSTTSNSSTKLSEEELKKLMEELQTGWKKLVESDWMMKIRQKMAEWASDPIWKSLAEWVSTPEVTNWMMNNGGQISQALAVWASSPAVTDWMKNNAPAQITDDSGGSEENAATQLE